MKLIKVKEDTKFEDISEGDLVITGEIHRVVKLFDSQDNSFLVKVVKPECSCLAKICKHTYSMKVGYGQNSFLKILEK